MRASAAESTAPSVRRLPQGAGDELREDDARVPARTHQDRAADVGPGVALERVDDRAHGQSVMFVPVSPSGTG